MPIITSGREKLYDKCNMILLNYQYHETNHDEDSSYFVHKKNYC